MSPSPELMWEGKYDKAGKRVAPVRVALPFQTVETVNESATDRQKTLDLFTSGRDTEWRNRLIWGDKKYVLPALLPEFQRKVDLIYIDPPFVTGADFTYEVEVGGESFTKEASAIEEKAYRDTWGKGLNSYLQWFYETTIVLRDLLDDWRALLSREKKRRGVLDNKLVFIGASNLARIAWCPMQAVRRSRIDEVSVFQTYIEERLGYCLAASRISRIPSDRDRWLELAAADPPLATVEQLLLPYQWQRFRYVGDYVETYAGDRSWAEPDMPRMAWQFSIAGYVIAAEPDGLTRSEVIEVKSARNSYLASFQRPVGELQADIYGVLFERKMKVLSVTIGDGGFAWDRSPVRHPAVADCVRLFSRVASGWTPPAPIEAWKCRNCEVNQGCPIRRT